MLWFGLACAAVVLVPLTWVAWVMLTYRRGMANDARRAAEQRAIHAVQLEEAGHIEAAARQRAIAAQCLDDERYFRDS